jgi:hypothetical protein
MLRPGGALLGGWTPPADFRSNAIVKASRL